MLIIILLSAEWIGVMNRFKDERVDSVAVTPLKVDTTWLKKAKKRSLAVLLYVCFYHPPFFLLLFFSFLISCSQPKENMSEIFSNYEKADFFRSKVHDSLRHLIPTLDTVLYRDQFYRSRKHKGPESKRQQAMRAQAILFAIGRTHKTETQIAEEFGYTRANVSAVVKQYQRKLSLCKSRGMKSEDAVEVYRERAKRVHTKRKQNEQQWKSNNSNSHNRLSTLKSALMQSLVLGS